MSEKPIILITGALGNLGLWLSETLKKEGANIILLAKCSKNLPIEKENQIIYCDISNSKECIESLKNISIDIIVHIASINNNTSAVDFDKKALEINSFGTRNMLSLAKLKKIKKFIYLSTFQVYGKTSGHITETTPIHPIDDYSITQFFAEEYIRMFNRVYGIPYIILRLTNCYGALKDLESKRWRQLINDLARMAVQEQKLVLKTNGEERRDFIWTGDVCNAISSLIKFPGVINDTFNLSSGQTFSLSEIAHFVKEVYMTEYGISIPVEQKLNISEVTNNFDLHVSNNKISELIPFQSHNKIKDEVLSIFKLLKK